MDFVLSIRNANRLSVQRLISYYNTEPTGGWIFPHNYAICKRSFMLIRKHVQFLKPEYLRAFDCLLGRAFAESPVIVVERNCFPDWASLVFREPEHIHIVALTHTQHTHNSQPFYKYVHKASNNIIATFIHANFRRWRMEEGQSAACVIEATCMNG